MSQAMSTDTGKNPLLQQIDLGFQAEAFLLSDLGSYLVQRAEAQIDDAVEALKQVDPEDAKSIRGLQNTINVAESIQYWLADAIQSGVNAQAELHDSE